MKICAPVVLIMMFVLSSAALGQGFRNIAAEELKKLIDGKNAVVIVDARTPEEFRIGHIPKAVNVPPEKTGAIGALLPNNKETAIVVYCKGGTG